MKYRIIKKDTNFPLEVGVLTNKGLITGEISFLNDRFFFCKEKSYSKIDLIPIGISLQPVYANPENLEYGLEYIQKRDEFESKIIKCSQELQIELFDKLIQPTEEYGADCPFTIIYAELDENEIEIINYTECSKYGCGNSECIFECNKIIELAIPVDRKLIKCYCGHTTWCDCGELPNVEI